MGITKCSGLIEHRGLLSALYSDIAVEAFLAAGLGLGRTQHHEALQEGEVGRKGKSVERTFAPISNTAELEEKVTPSPFPLLTPSLGPFLPPLTHEEEPKRGKAGRKGKSMERTFASISNTAELDGKVHYSIPIC